MDAVREIRVCASRHVTDLIGIDGVYSRDKVYSVKSALNASIGPSLMP